ncbi:Wadjet anti-phage system protein JetD domain-containing protein [Desulfuribacillus alkaliarsenatis]|uniref:Wadjet protein JetD C-terminal domain-containing protein n=1 Tax=Desulfuribacillus alkaliarsenatis TaxID=766136 RepID=A0A1E5G2E9_9FIRM|nr:Wadjet anti-phage system protein JetD domain-containing protein [Desulfuribacillus alkaliarsenatis]OEF97151.1 hypothetical protein BHF68_06020 [Desulfuribacillus alkaliarsenatis]
MINETAFKSKFCHEILIYLLQKYENSNSFYTGKPTNRRPQISFIGNNPFANDYFDEMDYYKKEWIHEVLAELEQKGVVSLAWEKYWEGKKLSKVFLNYEQIDTAYKIAGIESKLGKLNRLKNIIEPLKNHQWKSIQNWANMTIQNLNVRKQTGLNIKDIDIYEDLTRVLDYLPDIKSNVPKRILSHKLFSDSKYFEKQVEQPLASLLNKIYQLDFKSNDELLAYFGIVQHTKLVIYKGDLSWGINGKEVSSNDFIGGLGISDITVQNMDIRKIGANKIILIENLTSYEQWIRQRINENELVIYTGGYPHRLLQNFLEKLSVFLSQQKEHNIPLFHWGDIDIGGIKIFFYIKNRFFPGLKPLLMDTEVLVSHQGNAMAISESYRNKINDMKASMEYNGWLSLLDVMLELGVRLEQESIFDVSKIDIK